MAASKGAHLPLTSAIEIPILIHKRAIGFPGDFIIREKNTIKIGSRILSLVEKTHEGHPLTPTTLNVVPEGYLFVAGDHPRSIDSRYEEFGVVKEENIWGRGIFTW